METKLNYYVVEAKCGHARKANFIRIRFPVKAFSAKEAARVVKTFPRVKRNHKDSILSVRKIDYEAYLRLFLENSADPYLHCHSKHEQNLIDLSDRLEREKRIPEWKRRNDLPAPSFIYRKKRIRNPKYWVREQSRKEEDVRSIQSAVE